MKRLTRREFVRSTALAAAATQLAQSLRSASAEPAPAAAPAPLSPNGVELRWLDGAPPKIAGGATLGVPWPRGKLAAGTTLALRNAAGQEVPIQTWPLATWPDGSLKWTAHALAAGVEPSERYLLAPGIPATPAQAVRVTESRDAIDIDTGVIRCRIAKLGSFPIASITRDNREILRNGRLVCLREDRSERGIQREEVFVSAPALAAVEQSGPVRAVIRIEGRHAGPGGRQWLPFTVRLYFHAGGDAVRMMHTFVFDGDEQKDFIRGLGVRFDVPQRDALHNRHVRFAGEGKGLFAEGIRNLTGLRRDPGAATRSAQLAGTPTPATTGGIL